MKKDIIQFINEKYNEMTDSEKALADHIVNNYDRVLTLSVHALAGEASLSVATVVRFAQHMGFEGYKDFRLHLARLGADGEDFISDFKKGDGEPDAQISKMLSSCAECLALTEQNLDCDTLHTVAEKMHKAEIVAFFGSGTSYIVCLDAEMKFKRTGISTYCASEQSSATAILSNMKKGDVVFGISHSGNNEQVEGILRAAQKAGITTVAVTTFKNSGVCSEADHILYTQTRESPFHKAAISSRVGQFAMMDSLFMAYFTTYYDECIENIERLYKIRESMEN